MSSMGIVYWVTMLGIFSFLLGFYRRVLRKIGHFSGDNFISYTMMIAGMTGIVAGYMNGAQGYFKTMPYFQTGRVVVIIIVAVLAQWQNSRDASNMVALVKSMSSVLKKLEGEDAVSLPVKRKLKEIEDIMSSFQDVQNNYEGLVYFYSALMGCDGLERSKLDEYLKDILSDFEISSSGVSED